MNAISKTSQPPNPQPSKPHPPKPQQPRPQPPKQQPPKPQPPHPKPALPNNNEPKVLRVPFCRCDCPPGAKLSITPYFINVRVHPSRKDKNVNVFWINGVERPILHLDKHTEYYFNVQTPGYPFLMSTTANATGNNLPMSVYSVNVPKYMPREDVDKLIIKNRVGESCVFTFKVKYEKLTELFYGCTTNSDMGNSIVMQKYDLPLFRNPIKIPPCPPPIVVASNAVASGVATDNVGDNVANDVATDIATNNVATNDVVVADNVTNNVANDVVIANNVTDNVANDVVTNSNVVINNADKVAEIERLKLREIERLKALNEHIVTDNVSDNVSDNVTDIADEIERLELREIERLKHQEFEPLNVVDNRDDFVEDDDFENNGIVDDNNIDIVEDDNDIIEYDDVIDGDNDDDYNQFIDNFVDSFVDDFIAENDDADHSDADDGSDE